MGKSEIYLKAYFRRNLGDDMFVRCVSKRYPNVTFRICTSSAYAKPFKNLHNIRNLGSFVRLMDRVCRKLAGDEICKRYAERTAKAAVHIGGSVFIEPNHFLSPPKYYSHPNLFIIGCNFGPYKTDAYREFIFSRLQKAKDICFRDRYSYDIFSSLDHVRVAPDVLFGYPDYPTAKTGNGVGISVISLDERQDLKHMADTYYSVIAQVVDDCAQKKIPVKLFSFCTDEGDLKAVEEIVKRTETKGAEVCEYNGDIDSMLAHINSCEYIIATRFHAMVIGWCLSKKVFPVVYSDKQTHVMDDAKYMGAYWNLLETKAYTAIEMLSDVFSANHVNCVESLKKQSENQFMGLDYYLG